MAASATPPLPQVALIDKQIAAGWESAAVVPSPEATEGEWCRRVYLDLLGRIPKVEELERFLAEPPARRKRLLVDRLLGEEYADEFAGNWTTLWTNTLIGRKGGTERRSLVNRDGLKQSIHDAIAHNLPYDRMVYELLAAKGVSKPGEPGFNGFVNFLAGNLDDKDVQATAKSSQIFLGLQIQCTQCHNHPFNDWKQNQFWELNAFFRQTRALRRFKEGRDIDSIELVNQDFAGENNRPEEAVLFYELRNGLSKAAGPVFVDGTKLASSSGYVADVDRRTELATLVIHSEYLAPAIVNRMWGHFFGYGFTKPIDDMGPHNPPSHPELLAALAAEFKTDGFYLKDLMRWIVLSRPYGLSSRVTARNRKDDPTLGEKPLFSRFYLRQMRVEELYESLLVATEAQNTENRDKREATKNKWLEQFTVAFGTDDNGETTTFNGTIPQTLMMMNGELVKKATSIAKGSFLQRVATDPKMKNAAKINHLYLAALSRRPNSQEIALANKLLELRQGDAVAALQDVWWAVLNCNEFILNH
ncbi:MAG TPA: DUF1549 domain-containing protein [Pirellulales bacterium]|nr:DUF1549 domain-containing protein [Pirellulales bacterium]